MLSSTVPSPPLTAIIPLPPPFPFSNANTIHNQLYLSPESDVSSPPSPSRSPGTNPLLRPHSSRLSFLLLSHLLLRPPRSSSRNLPPPPRLQGSSSTRSSSLLLHHLHRPREGLVDLPLSRKKGLLVGEDNEERASFVKELWVNVSEEASTPVDVLHLRDSLEEQERPDRILIELSPTAPLRLNRLLLFLGGSGWYSRESNGVTLAGSRCVDLEALWSEVVCGQLLEEWKEGRGVELEGSGRKVLAAQWEIFMEEGIHRLLQDAAMPNPRTLVDQLSEEREEAWELFLVPDRPPGRVEITLDGLGEVLHLHLDSLKLIPVVSEHPLVILPPTGLNLERKEDAERVADDFRSALHPHPSASEDQLLFEDFPRSFWELIRNGPEFFWEEGWSWRREDGTVVGLKETFGRSEV
ncbi:hypothetical protein BDY24DRAFT_61139 [Mrakia frigida]|uniref:uncharacterized protein n=1 Tax=Mrakia frigida TaxID=29902 RepID=UPI003FCC2699